MFAGHFNEPDTYVTKRPSGMEDWLLTYTLDGEGYFRTAAGEKRCAKGDVAILRQFTPHEYGTVREQRWNFMWAHVPNLPDAHLLPEEEVVVQPIGMPNARKRLFRAFRNLLQDSRAQRPFWQPLCENAAREIVLLTVQDRRRNLDARVEEALQLLSRSMRSNISVDDIARQIGLSPSRLSHLFKQETGKTIIETLNELRIRQAAYLIAYTSRSISEAAFDTGFQTYNHFADLFRKQMGCSPREYRRSQQRREQSSKQDR